MQVNARLHGSIYTTGQSCPEQNCTRRSRSERAIAVRVDTPLEKITSPHVVIDRIGRP